jgi:GH43 family beta-xylosidase
VYVACAHKEKGNKSHRMYVIGGPPSSTDPTSTFTWEFLGPIVGLLESQWAIDGTVINLNKQNYFVYSGWPLNNANGSDLIQELFIVSMSGATTASSSPFLISQPVEAWEHSGNHGINEGPQFLSSPDGAWLGLAYSCAGSWTQDYKMNTLQYLGGDPLDRASWKKSHKPLLEKKPDGPFGPGHGSFINEKGGTIAIFHATDRCDEGWEGRKARVQCVDWTGNAPRMQWGNEKQTRGTKEHGPGMRQRVWGFLSGVKGLI